MTNRQDKAARVFVDYSQFYVAGGPDVTDGSDLVPHLLMDLGPQAVAVLTGLQSGTVAVTARAIPDAPDELDSGWDVVAETDLESTDGDLWVSGWGGHSFHRFRPPVSTGPGLYRLRIQARHRREADQERTDEEYCLLAWPARTASPAQLLTPMDEYGRLLDGERPSDEPRLDDLDLAAAQAVRHLADLVSQPGPPPFSGELTAIRAQTVAPGTPRKVWGTVASPWYWVTCGGSTHPAMFEIELTDKPPLEVAGGIITSEPYSHVAYTWSWAAGWNPPWRLPAEPSVVDIQLKRQGKGQTSVDLQHSGLPAELAGTAQAYWDWALRELHRVITRGPFYGYPWER